MNSTRRRSRGGRNPSSAPTRALAVYKREMHGYQTRPGGLAPKPFSARPFNTVKVHIYTSGGDPGTEYFVYVSTLAKALADQLGLSPQVIPKLTFKLQRVEAWTVGNTDINTRPSCNVDVSGLVPTMGDPQTPGNAQINYPILRRLYDQGTNLEPARVGYAWPLTMRDLPLTANADFLILAVATNTLAADVYFTLQWSTTEVQAPVP